MPTHWKKLNNPDYLGAYAFDPGEEKIGTIDFVRREKVMGADGKSEECTVAHFREPDLKPLILNVTNCKTISAVYKTPYIEDWAGKRILMRVEAVRAFGDVVDAVRVKKRVPPEKPTGPLLCESCGKPITAIGNFKAEDVARLNRERYGKTLCGECSKKLTEQKADGQEETANNA